MSSSSHSKKRNVLRHDGDMPKKKRQRLDSSLTKSTKSTTNTTTDSKASQSNDYSIPPVLPRRSKKSKQVLIAESPLDTPEFVTELKKLTSTWHSPVFVGVATKSGTKVYWSNYSRLCGASIESILHPKASLPPMKYCLKRKSKCCAVKIKDSFLALGPQFTIPLKHKDTISNAQAPKGALLCYVNGNQKDLLLPPIFARIAKVGGISRISQPRTVPRIRMSGGDYICVESNLPKYKGIYLEISQVASAVTATDEDDDGEEGFGVGFGLYHSGRISNGVDAKLAIIEHLMDQTGFKLYAKNSALYDMIDTLTLAHYDCVSGKQKILWEWSKPAPELSPDTNSCNSNMSNSPNSSHSSHTFSCGSSTNSTNSTSSTCSVSSVGCGQPNLPLPNVSHLLDAPLAPLDACNKSFAAPLPVVPCHDSFATSATSFGTFNNFNNFNSFDQMSRDATGSTQSPKDEPASEPVSIPSVPAIAPNSLKKDPNNVGLNAPHELHQNHAMPPLDPTFPIFTSSRFFDASQQGGANWNEKSLNGGTDEKTFEFEHGTYAQYAQHGMSGKDSSLSLSHNDGSYRVDSCDVDDFREDDFREDGCDYPMAQGKDELKYTRMCSPDSGNDSDWKHEEVLRGRSFGPVSDANDHYGNETGCDAMEGITSMRFGSVKPNIKGAPPRAYGRHGRHGTHASHVWDDLDARDNSLEHGSESKHEDENEMRIDESYLKHASARAVNWIKEGMRNNEDTDYLVSHALAAAAGEGKHDKRMNAMEACLVELQVIKDVFDAAEGKNGMREVAQQLFAGFLKYFFELPNKDVKDWFKQDLMRSAFSLGVALAPLPYLEDSDAVWNSGEVNHYMDCIMYKMDELVQLDDEWVVTWIESVAKAIRKGLQRRSSRFVVKMVHYMKYVQNGIKQNKIVRHRAAFTNKIFLHPTNMLHYMCQAPDVFETGLDAVFASSEKAGNDRISLFFENGVALAQMCGLECNCSDKNCNYNNLTPLEILEKRVSISGDMRLSDAVVNKCSVWTNVMRGGSP